MNKKFIVIASLVVLTGLLFMIGCPIGGSETTDGGSENSEVTMNEKNSPIRKVDFKNFTFSKATDDKDKKIEFTLKEGKLEKTEKSEAMSLGEVKYADLTGDKKEEAIVQIKTGEGDKAKLNSVYVYMLEDEDPKLIWNLDTSNKAMLKEVASNEGNLLVELFGDAKFEKGNWEVTVPKEKMNAEKQPTIFTKTQFKWNGKEFAVEGKPEVLDIEAENKEVVKKEEKESKDKEVETKKENSEAKAKSAS